MRIAPTQSIPEGNRLNQVLPAIPAESGKRSSLHPAAIASSAEIASCRTCLMLWTLLRNKDFSLAAELQLRRTNRFIDSN